MHNALRGASMIFAEVGCGVWGVGGGRWGDGEGGTESHERLACAYAVVRLSYHNCILFYQSHAYFFWSEIQLYLSSITMSIPSSVKLSHSEFFSPLFVFSELSATARILTTNRPKLHGLHLTNQTVR